MLVSQAFFQYVLEVLTIFNTNFVQMDKTAGSFLRFRSVGIQNTTIYVDHLL